MDSEKKSVNIPWLKVIVQGYIGGIALLIAASWKYLLGILVLVLTVYFTKEEGGVGSSWGDNSLRAAIGIFALGTFITVLGIFHMLFWYKTWARIAGLFALFGFLYGSLFYMTVMSGWAIFQTAKQVIAGRSFFWEPFFVALICVPLLYWLPRTCYFTIKESPNLFRWILKASQLKESIADLQKKADYGLVGSQKKEKAN